MNNKLLYKKNLFILKLIFFASILFFTFSLSFAQTMINKVTSIVWENNSLTINTTEKVSYTETRLKEPDRVIIDLLNCSVDNKSLLKNFKSELDETITISEPSKDQVRVSFSGIAAINRKSYLTNNERTLITRIARIDDISEDKVVENAEHTTLEKIVPGILKEINVEEDDEETTVTISATKPIKFNTYALKNPDRLAIDLLNILPPDTPLPKHNPTSSISSIRIGRAASGLAATRVVIDLMKPNLDFDTDTNLLGTKLEIEFKPNKEKEEQAKRAGIKVVVDPGHGGYDTGASYGGFEEKDINLIISNKLKNSLEDYGITVFLTREEDSFLSLAERVEITNSIKPALFISIHGNALVSSRVIRGVETYYWTGQSQKLAYYIHKSILSNLNIPDHFIRRAQFYVIRHTPVPAILAELGFLSNHDDRKLLTGSTTQDQYAKALTEAILKFLDIEPKKK